jgi:hypothetical protein
LKDLFADADGEPDQQSVAQMHELHRREWERWVASRDRTSYLMPKVWTCVCECHDEIRRTVLVVGSVNLTQVPRPWDLHQ